MSGIEGRHPSCADDVIGATDLALSIPDPSPSGDVGAVSGAGVESESKVAQDIALCAIEHQEGDHVENQGADRKDVSRSPTSTTYTLASTHTAPASAPVPVPSSSSKRTDMSSLGLQMINPDLSFIDQEMRFREEITCTYSSGLLSLAKANGIVFKPPSTASSSSGREGSTPEEHFKEEEGALMLLMQPMQALLDGTLLSAVSWQCRSAAGSPPHQPLLCIVSSFVS